MLESKLAVDCVTRILGWQILPAILQLVKSWLSDTGHRVTLGIVEFFFLNCFPGTGPPKLLVGRSLRVCTSKLEHFNVMIKFSISG